jgi:hypothetical protein
MHYLNLDNKSRKSIKSPMLDGWYAWEVGKENWWWQFGALTSRKNIIRTSSKRRSRKSRFTDR